MGAPNKKLVICVLVQVVNKDRLASKNEQPVHNYYIDLDVSESKKEQCYLERSMAKTKSERKLKQSATMHGSKPKSSKS